MKKFDKSFLLETYKDEIVPFLRALQEEHPGYDYNHFNSILSNIDMGNAELEEGFYTFSEEENTLIFDSKKMLDMGVRFSHILHQGLLDVCTQKYKVKDEGEQQFFKGINKMMVLALPSPESERMQTDVLQYTLLSSFSYIVEPDILVESFMKNSIGPVEVRLGELGIPSSFFGLFLDTLKDIDNPKIQDNRSYGDAQLQLLNMYETKMIQKLCTGELKPDKKVKTWVYDEAKEEYVEVEIDEITKLLNEFGATFIDGKGTFSAIYQQHNFNELRLNSDEKKKMWAVTRSNIQNLRDKLSEYGPFQEPENTKSGKSRAA